MGVYIKGMKMPESCQKCPLFNFKHERVSCFDYDRPYYKAWTCWNACAFVEDKMVEDIRKRPNSCPLVEVPTPYGRLIDADEFLNRAFGTGLFGEDDMCLLGELVGESPTIIPAEEDE